MCELVPIRFYDAELRVAVDKTGGYVAITPICRALGLSEQAQRRRIERHAVLTEGQAILATPSLGGTQETFCLRLDFGWQHCALPAQSQK